MHVEPLATRDEAARSLAGDGLELRLEHELPTRLAVGRGNAVFVYGSCFHRRRKVRDLRLLSDGSSIRPMAQAMPRRDVFESDPDARSYRSGFWGIVPIHATPDPRSLELDVVARLDDGDEVTRRLAALELEPGPTTEPIAWPAGRTDEPLVAICMATHDPPSDLFRRQIESIREQTHRNWMCVISDDHSREDRLADAESVVGDDPRFVISRSSGRLGFYRNFERALSLAPEEAAFLALADQDDRWDPDKLEALVSALGDAQLAYSDARVVAADGTPISDTYWTRRRTNHANLASLLISNTITGAALLFRRDLLDRILPFPSQLGTQWHDHWIGLVALATGDVKFVDRPLYEYVQHRDAVLGHAAANPARQRRGAGERLRMLRTDWRAAVGGWCWKYFYGVCRTLLLARVLELRCEGSLRGRKRRAVRWFLAIDSSPLGYLWLSARRLRRLSGRNETLGAERLFLHGLAWRRAIELLTWRRRRPPANLHKDASLPPADEIEADGEGQGL